MKISWFIVLKKHNWCPFWKLVLFNGKVVACTEEVVLSSDKVMLCTGKVVLYTEKVVLWTGMVTFCTGTMMSGITIMSNAKILGTHMINATMKGARQNSKVVLMLTSFAWFHFTFLTKRNLSIDIDINNRGNKTTTLYSTYQYSLHEKLLLSLNDIDVSPFVKYARLSKIIYIFLMNQIIKIFIE